MNIVPVDLAEANEFVRVHHRHHLPVVGHKLPWGKRNYVNPPYDKIGHFLERVLMERDARGAISVCLLPSRTGTAWWHRYAPEASEIRFIRGRLAFNSQNGAPFDSVVLIFGGNK